MKADEKVPLSDTLYSAYACNVLSEPQTHKTGTEMIEEKRKTGIDIIGEMPWGTHVSQFYRTGEDLVDILVPYFKEGLRNNELCIWITSEPLNVEDAEKALKKKVRGLDGYIKKGQLEILDYSRWYTKTGRFDSDRVLKGWVEKEKQALKRGFDGLRLAGNMFWINKRDWNKFTDYEAVVNRVIGKHRMLAFCSYSLDKCGAAEVIDVVSNHQFTLIKQKNAWKFIENSGPQQTVNALRKLDEEWRNTFDSIYDLISVHDSDYRFVHVNKSMADSLEMKREDIIGRHCYELLHNDSQPPPDCPHREAVKTGKTVTREMRNLKNYTYSLATAYPILDDKKEVVAVVHIARDISDQKKAEERLKHSEFELKKQKSALEQKNFALREMMEQITIETDRIKKDVAINIEKNILPILSKIRFDNNSQKYRDLLIRHLSEMTSGSGNKISNMSFQLTPKEIEICNMIKGGLTSKEICNTLNVSPFTIAKHRQNIREKIGLSNEKVNLSTYLYSL